MASAKSSDEQTPVVPVEADAPKYEPNYKYTIGKEEKEFDAWLKGAIKEKEHEEYLRDLYTRAHGLDSIKERHKQTQEYLKTERTQREQLQGFYDKLNGHVNRGDFQAFVEATGIPEKLVFEWVKQKLEYEEMDSERKRAYDQDREFRQRSYQESERLQSLEQQNQQILTQHRNFELDQALSKPEVQSVVKAYDEMAQRQGIQTFRDLVIERGIAKYHATGQDLPAEQIVADLAKMFQHLSVQQQQQVAPQQQAQPVVTKKPPVIPHVGGGNTSPVEKSIRTLEDLEKARDEHFANR